MTQAIEISKKKMGSVWRNLLADLKKEVYVSSTFKKGGQEREKFVTGSEWDEFTKVQPPFANRCSFFFRQTSTQVTELQLSLMKQRKTFSVFEFEILTN